jgi:hypothetical protein
VVFCWDALSPQIKLLSSYGLLSDSANGISRVCLRG